MENESVIVNKYESIERCINRINEEYDNNPKILIDVIENHLEELLEFARDMLNLKR